MGKTEYTAFYRLTEAEKNELVTRLTGLSEADARRLLEEVLDEKER